MKNENYGTKVLYGHWESIQMEVFYVQFCKTWSLTTIQIPLLCVIRKTNVEH